MINTFFRAKHWHLFLLSTGILIVFQFIFIFNFLSQIGSVINQGKQPDFSRLFSGFIYFPIVMLLNLVVVNGWIWSVGVGLQNKIPEPLRMNTTKFKASLIYLSSMTLLIMVAMAYFFSVTMRGMLESSIPPDAGFIQSFIGLIFILLPLQLLSMVCTFYSFYFAAKTFKIAELQRELNFENYMAEFFLIWFFPIGVWIIQPKLNKMLQESAEI